MARSVLGFASLLASCGLLFMAGCGASGSDARSAPETAPTADVSSMPSISPELGPKPTRRSSLDKGYLGSPRDVRLDLSDPGKAAGGLEKTE